jgi:hypothetical protein
VFSSAPVNPAWGLTHADQHGGQQQAEEQACARGPHCERNSEANRALLSFRRLSILQFGTQNLGASSVAGGHQVSRRDARGAAELAPLECGAPNFVPHGLAGRLKPGSRERCLAQLRRSTVSTIMRATIHTRRHCGRPARARA